MRHLDPTLLESFAAVAEASSFSAAGEKVGRTQSTVSSQIARLEHELSVRLFERTTRSVVLTDDGRRLLTDTKRLFAVEAEMLARFSERPLEGVVRFGASDDLASGHRLARLAADFAVRHPRVRLILNIGNSFDLVDALDHGRLDLVLLKRSRAPFRGEELWNEPMVWARAPSFDVEAREIALAAFPEPCVYRAAATKALGRARRPWRIAYESTSYTGILSAVREGFVVSVMAQSVVDSDLKSAPRVNSLPAPGTVRVSLARGKAANPAIDRFAALLPGLRD